MIKNLLLEWFLSNNCNFNCAYCPSHLKDGKLPCPDITTLLIALNNISNQGKLFNFDQVLLQINGGEPTSLKVLKELLTKELDPYLKFKLVTNGSADLDWWTKVKHKIVEIDLSYHLDCDPNHFRSVIELFLQDHRMISIRVPMPVEQEKWQKSYELFRSLDCYNLDAEMIMLYKNMSKGSNQYLDYTKEQWDIYYNKKNINNDEETIPTTSEEHKKINHLNNFYGHLCYAGSEQVVISYYGDVFRGWCMSNKPLGNVYRNTFKLNPVALPCPKIQCGNGFDRKARKSVKGWGLS